MSVERDKLLDGTYDRRVRAMGFDDVLSQEQRDAFRYGILERLPRGADLWVFAYGSLIWNPAFSFVERRAVRLQGYHRSFCLRSEIGRGTREQPGLMLALTNGGSCNGIAYRIAASEIELETKVIFAREMILRAYDPRWVKLVGEGQPIEAVTFVMNRQSDHYVSGLSEAQKVRLLATGEGQLGRAADYLHAVVESLGEWGIKDRPLSRLDRQVRDYKAQDCAAGDVKRRA